MESLYINTAVNQLRFCPVACSLSCMKRELSLGASIRKEGLPFQAFRRHPKPPHLASQLLQIVKLKAWVPTRDIRVCQSLSQLPPALIPYTEETERDVRAQAKKKKPQWSPE